MNEKYYYRTHLDLGDGRTSQCRMIKDGMCLTTDPSKVTCLRCKGFIEYWNKKININPLGEVSEPILSGESTVNSGGCMYVSRKLAGKKVKWMYE